MKYCIRLLPFGGRNLRIVEFEIDTDSKAIAAAVARGGDGPVDVWAEGDDAAWLLYRSPADRVPGATVAARIA